MPGQNKEITDDKYGYKPNFFVVFEMTYPQFGLANPQIIPRTASECDRT